MVRAGTSDGGLDPHFGERVRHPACLWHHRFQSRDEAFVAIAAWLDKYHTARPHSALGYLTPKEFVEQLAA